MNIKDGFLFFIYILYQVHSISARGEYYVDGTCTGTTRQFVLQEITSAIQRANHASIGVGSPTVQPSPTVRTFINWLFAAAPITSLYTVFGGGGQLPGIPVPNVGIKNLVYNQGLSSWAGQFDVVRLSIVWVSIGKALILLAGVFVRPFFVAGTDAGCRPPRHDPPL